MIQDIAPHTYDPVFRRKNLRTGITCSHYEYNKVMLLRQGEGDGASHLRGPEGADRGLSLAQAQYLFSIDDRAYYCVTDMDVPEFGGF
ncbi:MAG: hypothetical protein ACLSAC_08525 [Enterocloster bolteae]